MNIKYKHYAGSTPIDYQDEKLYDIELHDGTCIEGVEYWCFGDGFISHPRKERREMVDYHIGDIISFQLSEKEQK
jgi:hypothetical protein